MWAVYINWHTGWRNPKLLLDRLTHWELQSITMSHNSAINLLSSSTLTNKIYYSQLLSLTSLPPPPLPHSLFVIIYMCFWSHLNHSFTHSPPPPSLFPPSSYHLSHHICSLTVYNAIQGAHGLDGRPGPVVSGTSPVPAPLSLPLLFLHLPATACLIYAMSACHICLPSFFPCLSCLNSFLKDSAVQGWVLRMH